MKKVLVEKFDHYYYIDTLVLHATIYYILRKPMNDFLFQDTVTDRKFLTKVGNSERLMK